MIQTERSNVRATYHMSLLTHHQSYTFNQCSCYVILRVIKWLGAFSRGGSSLKRVWYECLTLLWTLSVCTFLSSASTMLFLVTSLSVSEWSGNGRLQARPTSASDAHAATLSRMSVFCTNSATDKSKGVVRSKWLNGQGLVD